MNPTASALRRLLAVAGVALAVPLAAQAQSVSDDFDGLLWSPLIARGPEPEGPPFGRGPDFDGPRFGRGPMPTAHGCDAPRGSRGFAGPEDAIFAPTALRGLALTEAQSDRVFAILHAQAPLVREKARAARRAHEELRAMGASAQFDAAKARALADTLARAQADLALLRAEGEHQIFAVLTAEQREASSASRRTGRRP